MKKRLLLTVFAVIAAIICTLGFAACTTEGNGTGGGNISGGGSISGGNDDNNDNDNNGGEEIPPEEETPAPHTHSSDKWLFDKNSHWKLCDGCDEKFGEAYHDENGTCEICGYAYATEGLAYELNAEKTAYTVTGIGEATDGKLVIPAEYNELPVTAIAVRAFSQCTSIISIEIPDSVTEIGSQAFYQCPNLQSAVLPAKLTDIGTYLFYECTSLKSVTVPVSVTTIGDKAFAFCLKLQTVNYNGTVAQWAEITKSSSWKQSASNLTVTCTDGTLTAAEA